MKSDRGGEFYQRNDQSGDQCLISGSFARYLKQSGIVPQYTMSSTPSMNDIAERRNQCFDLEFSLFFSKYILKLLKSILSCIHIISINNISHTFLRNPN